MIGKLWQNGTECENSHVRLYSKLLRYFSCSNVALAFGSRAAERLYSRRGRTSRAVGGKRYQDLALAWIFLLTILILGIMSLVRGASRRGLALHDWHFRVSRTFKI